MVKGGRLKRSYCVVTHLTMSDIYSYHIHEEDPIWDSTYMKLLHNLQDQYVVILHRTPNAGRKPVPGESAEYLILDKKDVIPEGVVRLDWQQEEESCV